MNVAGVPAAQYIRMSTEHQRYSPDNQKAAIASFAEARGFEIVKTYLDAGKSGLTLAKRDGLKQLLSDVISGDINFRAIFVLDVSRRGRFQNTYQADRQSTRLNSSHLSASRLPSSARQNNRKSFTFRHYLPTSSQISCSKYY